MPFLSAIVVAKAMCRFHGRAEALGTYSFWILSFILAICSVLAAVGTMAVWVLPIRRVWLGVNGGIVAGAGSVALAAGFAMSFYGGFENETGIYLGALSVAPGSDLAGSYAGFLRSGEKQAVERRGLP